MTPDVFGGIEPNAGLQETLAGPEQLSRYDAVADDLLFVIHVVDELIQRPDSLAQAGLQSCPVGGIDNAGDHIKREDMLVTGFRTGHTKRHPQVEDHTFGSLLTSLELAFRECGNLLQEQLSIQSWLSCPFEGL